MKRAARYITGVVVAIGGIYAIFLAMHVVLIHLSCTTEVRLKIENLSGVSFEVADTSCDTIAKDENIRIYARKVDPKEAGIFSRWRNQKSLLFRYDPGNFNNPLPSITRPSSSTILISVPEVSEIIDQKHEWAGMSIDYSIGHNENPELDISKPVYTMPRALVCPVSLLFDAHADHERETVNDLYLGWLRDPSFLPSTYVFGQESKAKALGCEIWQGGIKVEAVHMKQSLGGSWFVRGLSLMEISGNHFTTTDQLTNDIDRTVPAAPH